MPGLSFEDVLFINPTRVRPADPSEVERLEADLGVRLPQGYADYVERLGEGDLGHFVRILGPAAVAERTREWRERITEYWFWDASEAGLEPTSLQERGVLVGDSFDGDELCFDPADPEALFVLPRNEDSVQRVDGGFLAAVAWMLSGALNSWVEGWTFEVPANRREVREDLPGRQLADARRAIAALGEHSHVVDFDGRTTFLLPTIGGRLSIHAFDGEPIDATLAYDEDASDNAVARVLGALRRA